MYFEVLNRIVYDNEIDVISCLSDIYVCSALTAEEILEIVPKIKQIMESNKMSDLSIDIYDFVYNLPLNEDTIEKWETTGLNTVERFLVAHSYSAAKLEDMRYHVCKMCNTEYFSTDIMSEFCGSCAAKYDF